MKRTSKRDLVVQITLISCLVFVQSVEAQKSFEKRAVAYGKRFALIVGVGESKIGLTALPACIRDAKEVDAVFTRSGYETIVHHDELAVRAPTLQAVEASLNRIKNLAGPGDQFVVFFSCHGGVHNGEPHIFLQDAPLSLKTIKKALAESQAIVRVVLLDACRAERGFHTESSEYRDVHVVLSCRPDETSLVGPRGVSVFTEVLLEAFQDCQADRFGDGQIELDELLYYLDEHVPKRAQEIKRTHNQNPTRTVVDPRLNNPILGACKPGGTRPESQPVAFREPVRGVARNDAILPSALVGRVRIGMPHQEVTRLLGKPDVTTAFMDQYDNGSWVYGEKRLGRKGQQVTIDFERGVVASVGYATAMKLIGKPSHEWAERGFRRLSAGLKHTELTDAWKGISAQRLAEEFGPPRDWAPGGTFFTKKGESTWFYEIRGMGTGSRNLTVAINFGNYVIDLVIVYTEYPATGDDDEQRAKAQKGFAKLMNGRRLEEAPKVLSGISLNRIVQEMGNDDFSADQFGNGSIHYSDTPKADYSIVLDFEDHKVADVRIWVPHRFKAQGSAEKARAAFRQLSNGKTWGQIEKAFHGMSPQKLESVLGGTNFYDESAVEQFDLAGASNWTYHEVPEKGQFLQLEFSNWKVSKVILGRPVD